MVDPIIEYESYYKHYRVSRIDITSSKDFYYSIDDKRPEDSKSYFFY